VIEGPAGRHLAERYLSGFQVFPPDRNRLEQAEKAMRTFVAVGLLTSEWVASWRRSLQILSRDIAEVPLAPEDVRSAAREFLLEAEGELHDIADDAESAQAEAFWRADHELWSGVLALQHAGALTWREVQDEAVDPPNLEVERIIAAPPQEANDVVVSTVLLFEEGFQVDWYAARAITEAIWEAYTDDAVGGPAELQVADDLGTEYVAADWGDTIGGGGHSPTIGSTGFEPAPADAASELVISRRGSALVRISLR
jgi:hypothetical protein